MLFKKSALVLAASLLAMGAAHAAPPAATANLSVSINVTAATAATACTLTGMGISTSATYTSGASAAEVISGYNSLNLNCNGTDAVPYTIGAGSGNNASASSRRALFSGNFVDYQLHIGNYYAGMMPLGAVWDSASPTFGGSVIAGTTTPSGASSNAGVYFTLKVPAAQTAPTGNYTDVVLLTATF